MNEQRTAGVSESARLFQTRPEIPLATERYADRLILRAHLAPGLWRIDLATQDGGFDMEALYIRCHFRAAAEGNIANAPNAPRTGPWDFINNDFVVPRATVLLDGREQGILWFSLPNPEEIGRGRLEAGLGLRVHEGGEHVVEIRFSEMSKGLCGRVFCAPTIRPDERWPLPTLSPLIRQYGHVLPCDWAEAPQWREHIPSGRNDAIFEAMQSASKATPATCAVLGMNAAFFGALFHEKRFTSLALDALECAVTTPHWGPGHPGGMSCDIDMGAAIPLYYLSCGVAWLRIDCAEERLRGIVEGAAHHARVLHAFGLFQRNYWPCGYFQNHATACHLGLLAAGLLLCPDTPEGSEWAAFGKNGIAGALELLSIDGTGIPLDIDYGMMFVLQACDLLLAATGENLFARHRRKLEALATFRQWNPDVGQCLPVDTLLQKHLGLPLRERAKARVENAWASADTKDNSAYLSSETVRWCLPDAPGMAAPLGFLRHDDGECFTIRHEQPDKVRLRLHAHCGPVMAKTGHDRASRYHFGHGRPDCGAFTFFMNEQPLIGCAHASYRKMTNESTAVTVDGIGQFGEGAVWLPKIPAARTGRIISNTESEQAFEATMDLLPAYPAGCALSEYRRSIRFVRKNGICFIRDVLSSPTARQMEIRYHTMGDIACIEDDVFRISRGGISCILAIMDRSNVSISTGITDQVVQYTYAGTPARHIEVKRAFSDGVAALRIAILADTPDWRQILTETGDSQ